MPNIQAIARDLLRYIGITSLSTTSESANINLRTIETADLAFCAATINGALQEIFGLAPAYIREREVAEVLRAQTTVTLTATQYSKTISALTTYAAWMLGCTIRIAGDDQDNQIISSTELLRPFMGSTASGISATVFADAVKLDSTYSRVLEPVYGIRPHPLMPCSTKEAFFTTGRGGGPLESWGPYGQVARPTGEPTRWMTEARYDGSSAYLTLYLRVLPMPTTAQPITFRVKVKPTEVTAANIGDGTSETDPNIAIPADWLESILMPMCRKRFMAHPHFAAEPAVIREIDRAYNIAIQLLEDMSPMSAQSSVSFPR